MNPDFGEWYLVVDPEPSDDKLKKRWTAIEKLCKKPTTDLQLELLRVAYQLPGIAECPQTFSEVFQGTDASFRIRNNAEEQSLLAAVAIIQLLENAPPETSVPLALAATCASFQGLCLKRTVEEVGLHVKANGLLLDTSIKNRHEVGGKLASKDTIAVNGPWEEVKELIEQNQMAEAMNEITSAVRTLAEELHTLMEACQQFKHGQGIFAEEMDILWWVEGGVSRDLGEAFKSMEPGLVALVAGKELADLIRISPGPVAVAAFLDRAMAATDSAGELGLQEVVDATSKEWRSRADLGGVSSQTEAICPIHTAIRESCKSSTWQEAFSSSTGIDAGTKVRLLDIALQMYRERLLLRSDLAN